jgi:hypothetical protein
VPFDDGLRFDDDQDLRPILPESRENHPEESISPITTLKNESDSPDIAALSACCGVFISSYQTRCGIISPSL